MEVGKRITELRLLNEMKTVTELARKAGLSQPYLSQIEKGERNCPIDTLESICEALSITMSDFFKDEKITRESINSIRIIKKAENVGFSTSTLENIIDDLAKNVKKEY